MSAAADDFDNKYTDNRESLDAFAAPVLDALERCQWADYHWVSRDDVERVCIDCHYGPEYGHSSDCEIARLLTKYGRSPRYHT